MSGDDPRPAPFDDDPSGDDLTDQGPDDETWHTPWSTADGGQPDEVGDDRRHLRTNEPDLDDETDETVDEGVDDVVSTDLASSILASTRSMSQGRFRRRDRTAARRTRQQNLAGRNGRDRPHDGYSSAWPDPLRDPQRIGDVLGVHVEDQGWQRPLAQARVFANWSDLVGSDIAAHCAPTALNDGELRIQAESTAWATQLRLLAATLLARLVAELGPEVVTKLVITGPTAPSWKHGGRSVRGARGPRDTYG